MNAVRLFGVSAVAAGVFLAGFSVAMDYLGIGDPTTFGPLQVAVLTVGIAMGLWGARCAFPSLPCVRLIPE